MSKLSWNEQGGSAFPASNYWEDAGMSLRDYFAAKAMQALITKYGFCDSKNFEPLDGIMADCASRAYEVADAMLVIGGYNDN